MISDFHFIRPWFLVLLLLPSSIVLLANRSHDIRARWKGFIAPHLLDSLIVEGAGNSRVKPTSLLALMLAVAIIGASGPTWRREQPPFVADTATLVIAVDLSQTMDAIDVTPSRLERAKLKIKDVIDARQGARNAIVAYAGTAHLVIPPTEDGALVETYSEALATRIMPKPGKDTSAAIRLAGDLLKREGSVGTILILTDGVEAAAAEQLKSGPNGIVILGVGTAAGGPVKNTDGNFATAASGTRLFPKLDIKALQAIGRETGADVATVTDDDTDIRWIVQRIRSNFAQKQTTADDRWSDLGWWLVIPLVVAMALSFRRGWVAKIGIVLMAIQVSFHQPAHANGLMDMWLTGDQQGRRAFEHKMFNDAADHFSDPMWKGVAYYRAGKFQEAVDAFASVDTPESWYNQGNALLQLGKFEQAVGSYENALKKREDWADAKTNLAIASQLLKARAQKQEEQPEQPSEAPDSVQFDEKGKKGKEGVMNIAEQSSEMWMKNIVASPTDLMARKFSIEAGRAAR
ncbi:VWA domain-containing protein [Rhizobiales bacterium RZME27]|uniref:VWA domain-containing protein n=1 Tax=Endobacterium cereale TaxID=2663029 RepID=A0A6A8A4N4_9HYPH|nr:VWA domain-containing protein [Endobacterium cereale]MQY46185.1 VWA domain-containing protein [Endobacterium cereale]